MPSDDLALHCQDDLRLMQPLALVTASHYQRTRRGPAAQHGQRGATRCGRCSRPPTAPRPISGGRAGGCSSCRWPSCSASSTGSAGGSATTCSSGAPEAGAMSIQRPGTAFAGLAFTARGRGGDLAREPRARRDASLVDRLWPVPDRGRGPGLSGAAARTRPLREPRGRHGSCSRCCGRLRLSLFMTARNWGHGEDRRYQAIRARNQPHFATARACTWCSGCRRCIAPGSFRCRCSWA